MATGGLAMTRNSSELDVGSRLAAVRAARGMSQGTLARLAELPPSYVSRIETGHVRPTFATVERLLGAMHAGLPDLTAADEVRPRGHPSCPITAHGACLLELIRSEVGVARSEGREGYSLREIRLLREMAAFMRKASPERVRSIEALIEELLK